MQLPLQLSQTKGKEACRSAEEAVAVPSDDEAAVELKAAAPQAIKVYEMFFVWMPLGTVDLIAEEALENGKFEHCESMLKETDLKSWLDDDLPSSLDKKKALAEIGKLMAEFWN